MCTGDAVLGRTAGSTHGVGEAEHLAARDISARGIVVDVGVAAHLQRLFCGCLLRGDSASLVIKVDPDMTARLPRGGDLRISGRMSCSRRTATRSLIRRLWRLGLDRARQRGFKIIGKSLIFLDAVVVLLKRSQYVRAGILAISCVRGGRVWLRVGV